MGIVESVKLTFSNTFNVLPSAFSLHLLHFGAFLMTTAMAMTMTMTITMTMPVINISPSHLHYFV